MEGGPVIVISPSLFPLWWWWKKGHLSLAARVMAQIRGTSGRREGRGQAKKGWGGKKACRIFLHSTKNSFEKLFCFKSNLSAYFRNCIEYLFCGKFRTRQCYLVLPSLPPFFRNPPPLPVSTCNYTATTNGGGLPQRAATYNIPFPLTQQSGMIQGQTKLCCTLFPE